MNYERRKTITEASSKLSEALEIFRAAAEGEREYYDNMPEAIQAGERGEKASEVADALDEIVSDLENAEGNAQDIEL
jgi:hypothetical protein